MAEAKAKQEKPGKGTAKADAAPPPAAAAGDDPSMEEILQSIRRIIAEDDKSGPQDKAPLETAESAAGISSDVLELTEMVDEGAGDFGEESEASATDVLASIDSALGESVAIETPALEPAYEPPVPAFEENVLPEETLPEEMLAEEAAPEEAIPEQTIPEETLPPYEEPEQFQAPDDSALDAVIPAAPDDESPLISDEASYASSAALRKLQQARREEAEMYQMQPLVFRSGTTVEDLVVEAMRPMLKDWLDNHLPTLVERVVEREVRRLSGG